MSKCRGGKTANLAAILRPFAVALCLLLTTGVHRQEQNDADQQILTSEQMLFAEEAVARADRAADIESKIAVAPRNLVALTGKKGVGWRIVDVQLVRDKFVLAWVSPPLEHHLDLIDPADFKLVHTAEFDGVTVSGCMAHMCNTNRGIYLYVPRVRQGFEAKIDDGKTVTYTPNLQLPGNKLYREWMEKTIQAVGLPWQ
jgi:hypothetical protein